MASKFLTGIDLVNQRGINVADPTSATDIANKQYVDNLVNGLNWKDEVVVATTTNGTLATAYANGQSVDGVVLVTGDRILLKDQTTQADNGIYIVQASGAPVRATDSNTAALLKSATVLVQKGTVNADRAYTMTTDTVTLGTTSLTWSQFGGTSSYTAGNGLQLSAGQFSVVAATNGGIAVAAGGVSVALVSTGGIQSGASGLSILLPGSSGLQTTASGLALLLATNPGLQLAAGGLSVLPASGGGITVGASGVGIDTSLVSRRYSAAVGTGSASPTVTHNLGTTDVDVTVIEVSTGAVVYPDVVATNTTTVTLTFPSAPTTNQYRVVVTA